MAEEPTQRGVRVWPAWTLLLATAGVLLLLWYLKAGGSARPLPSYSQVPDFTLTNQFGKIVSAQDLRGRIWVADVIFTRCAGPCVKMTRQMKAIRDAAGRGAAVRFVSLTADPAYDTPEVLRAYAVRFEVSGEDWHFLTGPKVEIYSLAIEGLKLALAENDPAETRSLDDLFIHSTRFVLVDERGWIRGFYDGAEPASAEALLRDINSLGKYGNP